MDFHEIFKRERKERGYTADKLSELLQVDRKTVLAWDKGSSPKIENIIAIAELFECDIDYLLGVQAEPTKAMTDACETTGLSAEAIAILKNDIEIASLIDFILRDEELKETISLIDETVMSYSLLQSIKKSSEYKELKKILRDRNHSGLETGSYWDGLQKYIMEREKELRYMKIDVNDSFKAIINRYIKEESEKL